MQCMWSCAGQIQLQWILLCLPCRLIVFWMSDGLQVLYVHTGPPCLCVWWAVAKWRSSLISSYGEWSCSNRKQRGEKVWGTPGLSVLPVILYYGENLPPSLTSRFVLCFGMNWKLKSCFGGEKWLLSFCIAWMCTWVWENNYQTTSIKMCSAWR